MRTWAGELDRGAATGDHGRTHWGKKKLEQLYIKMEKKTNPISKSYS